MTVFRMEGQQRCPSRVTVQAQLRTEALGDLVEHAGGDLLDLGGGQGLILGADGQAQRQGA